MEVRITNNPAGYNIQVKEHWWSKWKTIFFDGMSSSAIKHANGILYKYMSKFRIDDND